MPTKFDQASRAAKARKQRARTATEVARLCGNVYRQQSFTLPYREFRVRDQFHDRVAGQFLGGHISRNGSVLILTSYAKRPGSERPCRAYQDADGITASGQDHWEKRRDQRLLDFVAAALVFPCESFLVMPRFFSTGLRRDCLRAGCWAVEVCRGISFSAAFVG